MSTGNSLCTCDQREPEEMLALSVFSTRKDGGFMASLCNRCQSGLGKHTMFFCGWSGAADYVKLHSQASGAWRGISKETQQSASY